MLNLLKQILSSTLFGLFLLFTGMFGILYAILSNNDNMIPLILFPSSLMLYIGLFMTIFKIIRYFMNKIIVRSPTLYENDNNTPYYINYN